MKLLKFVLALVIAADVCAAELAKKKIVLVAGVASHGKGEHEFNAGVQLLHQALAKQPNVTTTFVLNGWPKEIATFDGADAILFYMNGGDGHAAIQGDRLQVLDALAKKGVGLAFAHYGVEVPKTKGGPEFLRWAGGYFETFWSVNPTWTADFTQLPAHPITQGVKPFKIHDEWYYNMRFADSGVTPILTAIPPDSTRQGKDDAHGGNEFVRTHKGRPEVLAWAFTRPEGGRGFGFTGGHFHKNWADENFRKLFLNALLWTAKAEIPPNGVQSNVTADDLAKNWDAKR